MFTYLFIRGLERGLALALLPHIEHVPFTGELLFKYVNTTQPYQLQEILIHFFDVVVEC